MTFGRCLKSTFSYIELTLCLAGTPIKVELLEGIEAGEDTSAGNSSEDVGTGSLHQGHEALVLHDLREAVDGSLVLDGGSGGHHHTTTNGVDGVGHQARSNGDTVTQAEGQKKSSVGSEEDGLEGIVKTEIHSTVDENADARNDESSVESLDTVGLEGLTVDVDETVVLTFASLALGVVGQTGTGVIERIDEREGERSREAAGQDVGTELLGVGRIFRDVEHRLDLILEREVESLRREVTQAIGQISSPQGIDALARDGPRGAVDDAFVRLVETALTDHLILILDEQLDALDGRGHGLGGDGGDSRKGETLRESQLLVTHFSCF